MTSDEAAIERMARARYEVFFREPPNDEDDVIPWEGLDAGQRRHWLDEEGAALAALLADPPPAVVRAVLEQLIARADNQEWGGTVRADLWLRRELADLAQEKRDG